MASHRLLLLAGLAFACSSYRPAATYPAPEPIVIPVTPDSVWPAVVDVVTERQLAIQTIDRASGFLQTSTMRSRGSQYWDCGTQRMQDPDAAALGQMRTVALADQGVVVSLTISAVPRAGGTTLLRVTANPDRAYERCVSKGVLEAEFSQQIQARWRQLTGR